MRQAHPKSEDRMWAAAILIGLAVVVLSIVAFGPPTGLPY